VRDKIPDVSFKVKRRRKFWALGIGRCGGTEVHMGGDLWYPEKKKVPVKY